MHVSCLIRCRTWHCPQSQVLSHHFAYRSDDLSNTYTTFGTPWIFILRWQIRPLTRRRGNSVCQRIEFIRDRNASRRCSGNSFTRENSVKIAGLITLDQWSEITPHQKWQKHRTQHGELRTIRCPWSIDKLFKHIFTYFTYISYIFIAESRDSHAASRINKRWQCKWWSTRRLVAWTSRNQKPK